MYLQNYKKKIFNLTTKQCKDRLIIGSAKKKKKKVVEV